MIHRISVSNYFSIRDETVLDLRIPKTAPDLPRFRQSRARPDVRLPSVTVLMGPNGSGKTKLLTVLHDVACFASVLSAPDSTKDGLVLFRPFLATQSSLEPTRFRVDLEADWMSPGSTPELFRYDLAVGPAPASGHRVVLYEALCHFPRGRPRRLFERPVPGGSIHAARDLGFRADDERLKAVRDDASIIATLAAFNVPLAKRTRDWLRNVIVWSKVSYDGPLQLPTDFVVDIIQHDSELEAWINDEVRRSDLGITRVRSVVSKPS